MPKAVIEFIDGHTTVYSNVSLDHENRIVIIYGDNENVGFVPYEVIMAFSWKQREEGGD